MLYVEVFHLVYLTTVTFGRLLLIFYALYNYTLLLLPSIIYAYSISGTLMSLTVILTGSHIPSPIL